MPSSYRVQLAKEQFTFCSAHFITFAGNICEALHGHNYQVSAEVEGPLDENQYVVDFIAARDAMLSITSKLDHHVLLPTDHAQIKVAIDGKEVVARFEERRWVFPVSDCVLLPVANTTAELIAKYIAEQFCDALQKTCGFHPSMIEIAVDECLGQRGVYRWVSNENR